MQVLADNAASLGDVTQVIHTSGVSPSDTATENIIKINAAGTVNMVEAFYPALTEGGVMINFSSVAAYTMSKKFVIYFTQKMWCASRKSTAASCPSRPAAISRPCTRSSSTISRKRQKTSLS